MTSTRTCPCLYPYESHCPNATHSAFNNLTIKIAKPNLDADGNVREHFAVDLCALDGLDRLLDGFLCRADLFGGQFGALEHAQAVVALSDGGPFSGPARVDGHATFVGFAILYSTRRKIASMPHLLVKTSCARTSAAAR